MCVHIYNMLLSFIFPPSIMESYHTVTTDLTLNIIEVNVRTKISFLLLEWEREREREHERERNYVCAHLTVLALSAAQLRLRCWAGLHSCCWLCRYFFPFSKWLQTKLNTCFFFIAATRRSANRCA